MCDNVYFLLGGTNSRGKCCPTGGNRSCRLTLDPGLSYTAFCSTECGNSCKGPDSGNSDIAQVYCRFNSDVLDGYELPLCYEEIAKPYCEDLPPQGQGEDPFTKNDCANPTSGSLGDPGCDGDKVVCCDESKSNPVVPNNCDASFSPS